jgi:hypothetical protein
MMIEIADKIITSITMSNNSMMLKAAVGQIPRQLFLLAITISETPTELL